MLSFLRHFCAWFAVALGSLWASSARPPNILLLIDDQHRGDWLGAAGAGWMITPNLDRLAREGALFRRAYTSTPSCLPARAALLTGMSPWGHGCLGYVTIPESYPFEKPRLFTEAGWRTHVVGKNHYDPPGNLHGYETGALGDSNAPGLNYWKWFLEKAPGRRPNQGSRSSNDQRGGMVYPFSEELHRTTWTANRALEFLESYRQARPWFLKVSFLHPHPPFNPLARWLSRYENVEIPMNVVSDWSRKDWGAIHGSLHDNPDTQRGVARGVAAEDGRPSSGARRSVGARWRSRGPGKGAETEAESSRQTKLGRSLSRVGLNRRRRA